MDTEQFYDYIERKYGDYLLAQNTIKHWTNNWYNGNILDQNGFDVLSSNVMKYWTPQYDNNFLHNQFHQNTE